MIEIETIKISIWPEIFSFFQELYFKTTDS
jgi:hypothetical protein